MAYTQKIDPNSLQLQEFSPQDETLVPSYEIEGLYNPSSSKVEFFIYNLNNEILTQDLNFDSWRTFDDPAIQSTGDITTFQLTPEENAIEYGYENGKVNLIYNFIDYHLDSSPDNIYYISEISSDRTEIRLKTNIFDNEQIEEAFFDFEDDVLDNDYFDEFYLNLGDNIYLIGVNAQLDQTQEETSVLIKLYEPLPAQYGIKRKVYIVTKVGESVGYQVTFPELIEEVDTTVKLRGPNTNIGIRDEINNSTLYHNYNSLLTTPLSSSYYQLSQISNREGININVDYTDYSNFLFFSSGKTRLENFYYKVKLIENYQSQSNFANTIIGTTSGQISSSLGQYKTLIDNVIKNFDGFEYFMYYNSESKAWPKQNTEEPYILFSHTSSEVKTWLGSDTPNSAYFGGQILSASNYDEFNPNGLVNTIPEYIREDSDNQPYDLFMDMIGQHFDNIWLYTNNITTKLDRDNRLTHGVSKDLVADVLRSLGTKIYGGGFAVEDIYTAFLGYNTSGSLNPPTGSEWITNYITASNDPVPTDDAQKELYKRLYNNLPYLLKKKGTIEGIRNLITIYGIPDTILRISEFGGKDKENNDDYDYYYDRFSYALNTRDSASILIPWKPLISEYSGYVDLGYWDLYYSAESGSGDTPNGFNLPNSIQFRFKSHGIPSNHRLSQSIFVKKNDTLDNVNNSQSFDFGVFLTYTGSGYLSGSYTGSIPDPYNEYGHLELVISESTGYVSSSVYLPFYNKGFWTGMLTRFVPSGSTTGSYTLYAGNNIYNGPDGDQIGFYATTSIESTDTEFWPRYSTSSIDDGIHFGGIPSGSVAGGRVLSPENILFSGSFQEIRYSSVDLGKGIFRDFVMNPESIEGYDLEGDGSSFNVINFRADLGNELYSQFDFTVSYDTSSGGTIGLYAINGAPGPYIIGANPFFIRSASLESIHPAITASAPQLITQSFIYEEYLTPSSSLFTSNSLYQIEFQANSPSGSYADNLTETYYLDQPVVGLKNRITDKIKIRKNTTFQKVLSNQISIEQNVPISESYIRDVNILEVAFSPQNEINDDIIQTYGYFNIGEFIGDPRFISSSARTYPDLDRLQRDYFKKYYKKYNIFDYVRLIKYFDNSLFKMIKDYVPARTAVNTGVVIKQHMLERNRQRPAQIDFEDKQYTASIEMESFDGGTGGSVEQYNTTSFHQCYSESIQTPDGLVLNIHCSQEEFYNGEYSGSSFNTISETALNGTNPYLSETFAGTSYYLNYYSSGRTTYSTFANSNTIPKPGEIYLWYDSGSTI